MRVSIDNVVDIPSYFLLEIKLSNGFYNVYKYNISIRKNAMANVTIEHTIISANI